MHDMGWDWMDRSRVLSVTCQLQGGPGATASSIPEFPTQPPGETRHEIDAEFTGKAL